MCHPDDKSFGLGALLSTFAGLGVETQGLCFTHGEASTLEAIGIELTVVRAAELTAAAAVLGVRFLRLLSYPDGALSAVTLEELSSEVEASAAVDPIDCLLTFDDGGITGHPDHQRATEAALVTGDHLGVPVLAWCLPNSIAVTLNGEFGTGFVGREPSEIDLEIEVDRTLQHEAISCHASQSTHNPVLWRRLALQSTSEFLRWLSPSGVVRKDPSEEFLALASSKFGSAMTVGERDDRSGLGQYRFAAVTRRQVLQSSRLGISVKDAVEEVGQVRF